MHFINLQLELEIEQHVLSTVIKLSDGSLGHVFTRGHRNDAHVFLYNCHLCGIPNLPGERCLQTHIAGKKHQTKLAAPAIDAEAFRAPLAKGPKGKYIPLYFKLYLNTKYPSTGSTRLLYKSIIP